MMWWVLTSQELCDYWCDCGYQDFARWMVGEEPSSVYSTASSFMGAEDTAVTVLKFPNGALCVIDNSLQTSYGYDVRAEVLGNGGMATLQNPTHSPVIVSSGQGHSTPSAPHSLIERYEEAHREELLHWVDLLEGRVTEPKITVKDCLSNARLSQSIQSSRKAQASCPAPPSETSNPEKKCWLLSCWGTL